ncbi:MAG TPA: transglycosylase SLT domain-containing protein [Ktedonobacterales bacterium]|nr:transglycosylase SLT domain-containing protein [Ktedonobacterales bacterium]
MTPAPWWSFFLLRRFNDAKPGCVYQGKGVTMEESGPARVLTAIGRGLAGLARLRFSALTVIAVLLTLAATGSLLAIFTLPGAPGPLVITAPTATDQPLTLPTATSDLYPTSAPATPQGNGLGAPTPNAPIIPTPQPGVEPVICPTAVALPTPTTSPGAPTPTTATGQGGNGDCIPCGVYLGDNPEQSAIASALATAADVYSLPHRLMEAVAWQESNWHEDIVSCDGGIGLMQIQDTTYPWLNQQSVPACHIGLTSYDPFTLEGNADLGAKYLKYLSCFYGFWGDDNSATLSAPATHTSAWYYQRAGRTYPDTSDAGSLCAAVFQALRQQYSDLPSTTSDPWSCPFSARSGDYSLLDLTLSAYNEGAAYTDAYGVDNLGYVRGVERLVVSFANGDLPD